MDLSETDKNLIAYMYHHNREPITKIAKSCKLTREQTEYRLSKYEKEKLILGYKAFFNYPALGYASNAIVMIKTKTNEFTNFEKLLNGHKNCISYGNIFGEYDIYLNLVFEDEDHLQLEISKLLNQKFIQDYVIIKPFYSELYHLKMFDKEYDNHEYQIFEKHKKIDLEDDEKKILKMLSKNSRMRLKDIAYELSISSVLANYKIKKLFDNKIILGSKAQINTLKLKYHYAAIWLSINEFTLDIQDKLKRFAHTHRFADSILMSIQKPNCMVQFLHKTPEELFTSINDLKKILLNCTYELKITFPQQEKKIDMLPFL